MAAEGDQSMREQIIGIVVDALRDQRYPDLTVETIRSNAEHRDAFVEMLEACRPLPVITQLIADVRGARF